MSVYKIKKILPVFIFAIFLAAVVYYAWPAKKSEPSAGSRPAAALAGQTSFNKNLYSTVAPDSIWVIVNKQHPLNPLSYAPLDLRVPNVPLRVPGNQSMQLRGPAAVALEQMFTGAKNDGLPLMLSSGYRSYTYQVGLYNGYVSAQGQASADQISARPGHSEHQTGLAADIEPSSRSCEVSTCFADTPEGKWLAANSYKYGFILRYGADKVSITGYEYEPWHFRYVGPDLAKQMHDTNIETLEEFFNVSGGPNY